MTKTEQLKILDDWIGLHKGLLFKIVRAYAGPGIDHDDLFQEIIIQIWKSIPAFQEKSAVTTWLYRIALNTAIKWISRQRKHTNVETLDNLQHVLLENKTEPDERLTWLYEAIQQLDKIDRSQTLLMLDGFSYKEMALLLGISESNVGVKINRIKKQLIVKSKT